MRRPDTSVVVTAGALAGTMLGLSRMARFAAARHRLPHVPSSAPPSARVSAVVPARDEAARIERCLAALLASGPDLVEVVVVDDGSTDGTGEIARATADGRVRVVRSPGPQPGELGKPVACATGAGSATGDWLWFVDADAVVAADALRRLLAAADDTGAVLVSALGRPDVDSAGLAWLLPEVGLGLTRRLSLDEVTDPTSPVAFAAGPCLLVSRAAYEECGGHGAVSRAVVEDVELAARVKARGLPVRVALAPDAAAVGTYASLAQAWQGLLKNSAGVRGHRAGDVGREAVWAAVALVPLVALGSRSRRARRLGVTTLGLQVVTSAGGRAVAGLPVWPALAAPLAELALIANWVQSVRLMRVGGAVSWRGRAVAL